MKLNELIDDNEGICLGLDNLDIPTHLLGCEVVCKMYDHGDACVQWWDVILADGTVSGCVGVDYDALWHWFPGQTADESIKTYSDEPCNVCGETALAATTFANLLDPRFGDSPVVDGFRCTNPQCLLNVDDDDDDEDDDDE